MEANNYNARGGAPSGPPGSENTSPNSRNAVPSSPRSPERVLAAAPGAGPPFGPWVPRLDHAVLAALAAHVGDASHPLRTGLAERQDVVRVLREIDAESAVEPRHEVRERALERLGARVVHPRE